VLSAVTLDTGALRSSQAAGCLASRVPVMVPASRLISTWWSTKSRHGVLRQA
jgi:hypothetical protein